MEAATIHDLINLEYDMYEHTINLIACIKDDFKQRLLTNIRNFITDIISKCRIETKELRREIILESRLIIYVCIMFSRIHMEKATEGLQVIYDENHEFDEDIATEINFDSMNVIDKSLSFSTTKRIYERCDFYHITEYIKWLLSAFRLEEDSILIKAEKEAIVKERKEINIKMEAIAKEKMGKGIKKEEMAKIEKVEAELIEKEKELLLREKIAIEQGVVYIKCLTKFVERLCIHPKSEFITFLKDRFDIIIPALIIMTKKTYGDDYVHRNTYYATKLKIDIYDINYLEIVLLLNLDVYILPKEYEAYFNDKMKLFLEL